MTDRTWYLWWIAVDSTAQGRGLGSKLLAFVEADIRERNGRLLLVETATLPDYEPTRRFYIKHGYTLAATIQDYYADGDGMALFGKRLTS
jgi:ribosomal protein S18 acetylase RimI-like enzyme